MDVIFSIQHNNLSNLTQICIHIVDLYSNSLCNMPLWGISKCKFCIYFSPYPCTFVVYLLKHRSVQNICIINHGDFCKLFISIVLFSCYWIFISKCCNFFLKCCYIFFSSNKTILYLWFISFSISWKEK